MDIDFGFYSIEKQEKGEDSIKNYTTDTSNHTTDLTDNLLNVKNDSNQRLSNEEDPAVAVSNSSTRLFLCSTDYQQYNRSLDSQNETVDPNTILGCLKTFIEDADKDKPDLPLFPGMECKKVICVNITFKS
jgi:hypothetical protein